MEKDPNDYVHKGPQFQGRRLSKMGNEVPDPTPMQPPVGFKKQPSIAETIRQQVRAAKALEALEIAETEDEADDFDIGDDVDPHSPWENDNSPSIKDVKARRRALENELKKAKEEGARSAPPITTTPAPSPGTAPFIPPAVTPGADPSKK